MAKQEKQSKTEEVLLQDLRLLQAYLEDLWNFLPIPACDLNGVFNIINVGRRFLEFLEYEKEEIIGENIKKLFQSSEEFKEFKAKLSEEGELSHQRIVLLTKKGEARPVSVFVKPRIAEGAAVSYFVAFIDLREIEKKELELREKIEELEKFHKLAIGRELKMVELKEEIEKLKKELEEYKGRK